MEKSIGSIVSFYNTIQDRLDVKYQNIITQAVWKYQLRLSKYSREKQIKIHDKIIERVEAVISDLLLQYPADIALPEKVNNKYLAYTLLKFELMLLDF